jgi:membrane-bound inhibitor of C-type lysozyme
VSAFVINSYAFGEDPDAKAYLDAVESADAQALEVAVRKAVDDFVRGCKADGIWSAIKASCILAGARTLTGALTPLVGSAPTNNSFVSGDYNRETGLLGNGTTKYLTTNRNNNADPQNSKHIAVYVSTAETAGGAYIGAGQFNTGDSNVGSDNANTRLFARVNNAASYFLSNQHSASGLIAASRSSSSGYTFRSSGADNSVTRASESPSNNTILVFARTGSGAPAELYSNGRIAFYSIGESLDLADLDTRVSTLITDLAAAIP